MRKFRNHALAWSVVILTFVVPSEVSAFKQEDLDKVQATKQCTFCDLAGAPLTGLDISGGRLSGTKLSGANLSKANLSGANVRNANLHGAQLVGANLSNGDLSGASLAHAKLTGADLSEAKLSGTDLSEANLSGAYWTDGKKCKEGSIGECKKDPASDKGSEKGHHSHGGMHSLNGGQ